MILHQMQEAFPTTRIAIASMTFGATKGKGGHRD
jgi:hypothetical protein